MESPARASCPGKLREVRGAEETCTETGHLLSHAVDLRDFARVENCVRDSGVRRTDVDGDDKFANGAFVRSQRGHRRGYRERAGWKAAERASRVRFIALEMWVHRGADVAAVRVKSYKRTLSTVSVLADMRPCQKRSERHSFGPE